MRGWKRILWFLALGSAALLAPWLSTLWPGHGGAPIPQVPKIEAEPPATPDGRSGAWEALQLWSDQRAYPGDQEPDEAYYRAHQRSRALAKEAAADPLVAVEPWKSIGPANRGGRTIALAVDPRNPDIVYAGAASGGLWRMTQTGGTGYRWEHLDTRHPVLGVHAIAVDPRNSRILYIGTGEVYGYKRSIGGFYQRNTRGSYGIGLLKSIDSGATWTKSIDWSYNQLRGVQVIRLHPTKPDIVFAGTTEGLFRSLDAGATWEQVQDVLMVEDIAINPKDPDMVFVSCGNLGSAGSGLYRSTTGGGAGSFTKLAGGLPSSWGGKALIGMFQANPATLYLDVASANATVGIFRSTNNGEAWTRVYDQDIASYQGWFAHYIRVHPTNSDRILAAGVEFMASTDGGASFAQRNGMHVDHHCFADHPTDPEVVYFGNDGGVYRSADGGATFRAMNNGYATVQFYAGFASSPKDPNLAIGGLQDNGSVIYTGSTSWRSVCGGDGTYAGINAQDDNLVYCASQNLSIRRSTNRGQTFSGISDMGSGSTAFVAPYALAPSNGSVIYAGKSIVYKTTDGGSSWTAANGGAALNGNPALAVGVSPQDPNVVFVSTAPGGGRRGSVFASYNGGSAFKDVTGTLPDRYYMDLVVSPNDKNTVYVALSGFGSPHLFRSEDAGATWTDVGAGLPDVPTHAVALDPANPKIIYVGNDLGVYVSGDGARTWAPWKDGMPTAAMVYDLSLSLGNRRIRAVTHGHAVHERAMLPPQGVRISDVPPRDGLRLDAHAEGVAFALPRAAPVSLEVSDIRGHLIRTLASGRYPAGRHIARWDGKDAAGRLVPAGTYFCRLRSGREARTLRIDRRGH